MFRVAPTRTRSLLWGLLGFWLVVATMGSGGAWALSTETYRDNFDSVSYSGSNGTAPWSGNWLESGESDGPTSGRVRVVTRSECVAGSCGRLSAGSNTTAGIHRRADLSGASSATLTFRYQRTKSGGAAGLVRVSVSSDGGSSWSTLATYSLDVSDGSPLVQSFGITPYVTTQTQVRFRVESTPGQSGTFHFDNVQIAASFPDPTTTTTSTSTSSTTTSTTSRPPSSTTTTTTSTSTTTIAPSSTTTIAESTTTTGPPLSTTTATSSSTTTTLPAEAPTTSVAEAAPTTTVLTAPLPPREAGGTFAAPFPIRANDPAGSTVLAEPRALNSTEPNISDLVIGAMAEFVKEPETPPVPDVDVLQAAATGATAGVGSTTPIVVPVGLAGLGLVIGRLTRRRR